VTARLWRSKRLPEATVRQILNDEYVKRARKYAALFKKWQNEAKEHLKHEVDVRKFIEALQERVAARRALSGNSFSPIFDQNPSRRFWDLSSSEWKDLITSHIH
jgi:hypothetical protein